MVRSLSGSEARSAGRMILHRKDLESTLEFTLLKCRAFLASTTAVIHGVAFEKNDFRNMRLAATPLIWSPRSNIGLYGTTTDVVTAYRKGGSLQTETCEG